jgi:hypothetical protein
MMNRNRAIQQATVACALAAALALPTVPAQAQVTFSINIGPPALLYEPVPVMAPGYIWAPGYWAWHDDRHIWVRGRTIIQRTGYRWEPDRWEQQGPRYVQRPGRWEREYQQRPLNYGQSKKYDRNDMHDNGKNKGKYRDNDRNRGDRK